MAPCSPCAAPLGAAPPASQPMVASCSPGAVCPGTAPTRSQCAAGLSCHPQRALVFIVYTGISSPCAACRRSLPDSHLGVSKSALTRVVRCCFVRLLVFAMATSPMSAMVSLFAKVPGAEHQDKPRFQQLSTAAVEKGTHNEAELAHSTVESWGIIDEAPLGFSRAHTPRCAPRRTWTTRPSTTCVAALRSPPSVSTRVCLRLPTRRRSKK